MTGTLLILSVIATPTPAELSRSLDEMYRSSASHGRITMHIKTPDYERKLEMEVWSRGKDKTLVRILSPRKEKGVATLKKGKEMWNWLPKIKRTIRVPPSMMMSSWMGSDLTNDDLVRESSWETDYTATVTPGGEGEICLTYERQKDAAVAWDRVIGCFDAVKLIPLRLDFFDDKGRKARTIEYTEVRDLGGRMLPTKMSVIPHTKQGHRTEIVYADMSFDADVPDDLFTLSRLRRGR